MEFKMGKELDRKKIPYSVTISRATCITSFPDLELKVGL